MARSRGQPKTNIQQETEAFSPISDMSEIWCCDSDRGTTLGRSIPYPPALCSLRKIHLLPRVLRRTNPRNISPILNPRAFRLIFIKYENPAQFTARLAATLRRFTALDPKRSSRFSG
ncbi:embryonic stem cell-related gene protein-like [Macaca fascicularis]|uniref:embryonic stem cell-related gene protein-like n=1 Tax=Macaca fascicularis TaxID=9541 RepID=UPI0032B08110